MSSTSRISDVANLYLLPNMQPTEAPQVQVIERPGSDHPNKTPSNADGFGSVQRETSVSSHESLFSIHVDSFTRCPVPATGADPHKSGEQDKAGEFMESKESISFRGAFQVTEGGENNKEDLGTDNVPVSSETSVELRKEGDINDQEKREYGAHTDSSALPTQCCCCCKLVTWTCCHCKSPTWSCCFSLSSCSCKCPTWQSFMCNCSNCCGGGSSNIVEEGPEQHTKSSKKASGLEEKIMLSRIFNCLLRK